jgi:hypothetical protein
VLTQLSTADSSERHCGLRQASKRAVCRGDGRLGKGHEDGLLSAEGQRLVWRGEDERDSDGRWLPASCRSP